MAKEIRTFQWCDIHMQRDEQVEGHSVVVSLNGGKPKEIDLCDVDMKELIEPLRLLLEDVGQPVGEQPPAKRGKKSAATPAPTTLFGEEPELLRGKPVWAKCPVCQKGTTGKNGLGSHLNTHHDKTLNDADIVEFIYGGDNPLEGPHEHQCPNCIASYTTPQGLGSHRQKAHDYVSPAKA